MRHGGLVTRDELLSRLWPDTFVDESNLTGAIWAIRKALGQGERWIETVPKLGYRFLAPVQERLRLARTHAARPDAHEAYLRGRHHWRQITEEGFCKARDHLHQAIALDPMFPAAHAALADVHIALGAFGVVRPTDAFAQAEASARRALELDANLGDAHRTLALVRMYHWDWPRCGCGVRMRHGGRAGVCRDALPLRALPGRPRTMR